MEVTKSNYEEALDELETMFGLKQITSVSNGNGYPEGILPLLIGLEDEEQVEQILKEFPQAILYELEWKNGWTTYYRLNKNVFNEAYDYMEILKYDNDIIGLWTNLDNSEEIGKWHLGDALQDECNNLIRDLNNLGLQLEPPTKSYEDCGVSEYQEFCERANKLIINAQNNDIDIPMYIEDELNEIEDRLKNVVEIIEEVKKLQDDQLLAVDYELHTDIKPMKSMSYYDDDVTHRCIAVGFDPDLLPEEDEDE